MEVKTLSQIPGHADCTRTEITGERCDVSPLIAICRSEKNGGRKTTASGAVSTHRYPCDFLLPSFVVSFCGLPRSLRSPFGPPFLRRLERPEPVNVILEPRMDANRAKQIGPNDLARFRANGPFIYLAQPIGPIGLGFRDTKAEEGQRPGSLERWLIGKRARPIESQHTVGPLALRV
mgnify:CR=1 FL=1